MLDKKLGDYTGKDVVVVMAALFLMRHGYKVLMRGMSPVAIATEQIKGYSDKVKSRLEDQ